MSDSNSNNYEELLNKCDYLINKVINKDLLIKNVAQRLEHTLNLLEIASEDGNEPNVIQYSLDAIMYRNILKSQI